MRYSSFVGGWDITFNYLYHYHDLPVFYGRGSQSETGPEVRVEPAYERNHLLGSTLSNVFGDMTLRAEIAYSTDTFHIADSPRNGGIRESAEVASVIGVDWMLAEHDTLLSAQWFQSTLLDYDRSIEREETEHNLSLLYQRDFDNETWKLHAIWLYSPNRGDSLLQAKLSYNWRSNVDLWVGADIFSGDDEGFFGQFGEQDRLLVGFQYAF